MRQTVLLGVTLIALASYGASQSPPQGHDSSATSAHKRIFVDGNPIAANRVIVKEGASYVDVSVLAQALGASVISDEETVTIKSKQPKCDCEKTAVEGKLLSEQFRTDVAGVADEIESLRAVVLKKENVPLGPRFDAIDRKLSASKAHVQTDADAAVYYALSYASNSLAITYYKQVRGVPAEEAQKNEVDSMMCAMESKFALMKGALLPGGTCSVFKRMEGQSAAKPPE